MIGAANSWHRLIEGKCGIKSIKNRPEFNGIPSQVAATVPLGSSRDGGWDPTEWLRGGETRRMALFAQYAIAATEEALNDAQWMPTSQDEREKTVLHLSGSRFCKERREVNYCLQGVCLGSGIGSLNDMYDASTTFSEGVSCDFLFKNVLAKELLGRQETECPFHSPAPYKSCCRSHHHEAPFPSQFLFPHRRHAHTLAVP